jgi:Spy/CpxP family protein refolding chaperone
LTSGSEPEDDVRLEAGTMKLHLTISRDGWLSLWDVAPGDKSDHGASVDLELTPEQEQQIRAAMLTTTDEIGSEDQEGPWAR